MPGCNSSHAVELHEFADASERAYAAYLRSKHQHQGITTILVAAKTKVALLKQISLPRLELSAATLLAQLLPSEGLELAKHHHSCMARLNGSLELDTRPSNSMEDVRGQPGCGDLAPGARCKMASRTQQG